MTLYEINEQIKNALDYGCDPETGEIIDDSSLQALQIAWDEKIENICLYIKELRAEETALKNEEDALKARREGKKKRAESLSRYLQNMLAGQKFNSPKTEVSYRKTQAVTIDDADAIPHDFMRFKTTSEPNKTAIKEAIKAGGVVPGAHLEERQSMTIK